MPYHATAPCHYRLPNNDCGFSINLGLVTMPTTCWRQYVSAALSMRPPWSTVSRKLSDVTKFYVQPLRMLQGSLSKLFSRPFPSVYRLSTCSIFLKENGRG